MPAAAASHDSGPLLSGLCPHRARRVRRSEPSWCSPGRARESRAAAAGLPGSAEAKRASGPEAYHRPVREEAYGPSCFAAFRRRTWASQAVRRHLHSWSSMPRRGSGPRHRAAWFARISRSGAILIRRLSAIPGGLPEGCSPNGGAHESIGGGVGLVECRGVARHREPALTQAEVCDVEICRIRHGDAT